MANIDNITNDILFMLRSKKHDDPMHEITVQISDLNGKCFTIKVEDQQEDGIQKYRQFMDGIKTVYDWTVKPELILDSSHEYKQTFDKMVESESKLIKCRLDECQSPASARILFCSVHSLCLKSETIKALRTEWSTDQKYSDATIESAVAEARAVYDQSQVANVGA